jgi:hypothetical protein
MHMADPVHIRVIIEQIIEPEDPVTPWRREYLKPNLTMEQVRELTDYIDGYPQEQGDDGV